jgi:hypothetical protein
MANSAHIICLPLAGLLVCGLAACGSVEDPLACQPQGDQALVVTSDYRTGGFVTLDQDSLQVTCQGPTIHPDAICRFDPITARPYLVSRMGADAVEVLDPAAGFAISREYSVGAGSNPQDIAVVSAERAYVLRYAEPSLLVVEPLDGSETGEIDLSAWADPDGLAEPGWAVVHGQRVFVALHRLDNFAPTDHSSVVVLDAGSGQVQAEIRLSGVNPFARMRYSAAIDRITIGQSGRFGAFDGGLEWLDPASLELSGWVIDEQALGGDLTDAAVLSGTKAYAVISETLADQTAATRVISFDPSRGAKLADLAVAEGFDHSFLELSPDGAQLWITERTRTAPGVRVFDTGTDQEISAGPIDVGLPPFMICFVPDPS